MPDYRASAKAIDQALALGWADDISARLVRMAKASARITHPHGNRRCEEYLLEVAANGEVLAVHQFDPATGELLSQ